MSAIALLSDNNESKEAVLVRSTSELMPPEATISEQQLALRVLATERVEAFDSTMLMDDRNLPLIQLSTRGGFQLPTPNSRPLSICGFDHGIQAAQRVVGASGAVLERVPSMLRDISADISATSFDTHGLLNITVTRFLDLLSNPMAWDASHDSVVDCSIRTLLKMYKCAQMYEWKHTQMLLSMTTSMMTSVVLINEHSYKFTNASKVLLNTPRNDIPTSFMQEKLFNKVRKQLRECEGCRRKADCYFFLYLAQHGFANLATSGGTYRFIENHPEFSWTNDRG